MQPLRLLLILSLPPPSRDPRLPLVVPYFLIAPPGLDTFTAREAFPFGWGIRFGLGLGAGVVGCWGWKLGEGAFGRGEGR